MTEAQSAEAATGAAEEATEPAPAAAEAEEAETAPAGGGARSCLLNNHCREYTTLPHTVDGPDGASMEITEEMVQQECSRREGTWSDGPCDTEGVLASCDEGHMVWHYREGADLAASEDICREVREGTWTTL